jgi:hypothetical protein
MLEDFDPAILGPLRASRFKSGPSMMLLLLFEFSDVHTPGPWTMNLILFFLFFEHKMIQVRKVFRETIVFDHL